MTSRLVSIAAGVLLLGAVLVACGDDTPACAATTPTPFDALRMPSGPRPPAQPPKPYKPPHKWGQPYGKARPVPQQPVIVNHCTPIEEGNPDHD